MSRDAFGVVTGLLVLVIGVVAVVNMIWAADESPAERSAPATTRVAVSEPVAAEPVEELPGVGPAVIRVLQRSGNLQPAAGGDLAQLPPSVVALLVRYGVPLRVPIDSAQTQ
jgi:hypothetical protein